MGSDNCTTTGVHRSHRAEQFLPLQILCALPFHPLSHLLFELLFVTVNVKNLSVFEVTHELFRDLQ